MTSIPLAIRQALHLKARLVLARAPDCRFTLPPVCHYSVCAYTLAVLGERAGLADRYRIISSRQALPP